ncbi:laminin subunit beta-1-like protein [Sarcoptes scabiei]|uniref:Laminin subunit beta-1 n=1 Tax=Sarcoptes scabiei TaxID=52283 RepID=A0A131ZYG1_SARSC|nr:laminin subunit beta-1-like protein [Sarcoptes scabiei]
MLIERSHDFGRTWKVYQYFAYDCAQSFPGVQIGPRNRITDVVCDSRYSHVEPSTEGEIIFRVLPPNIRISDPYAKEVQDILKITNLRINFTQLHTLGDNLLDPRVEVKEKYYYAIYEMVVRGSCSCYGHASRCIPSNHETVPDMVYGRCECTHHTKGLNCELCEDLYNDLEWKPAIGRQTNACKKCECNNHASRCHFDMAVYQASNNVSGGVCDDCQHNTMGVHCELCRPSFYRDPNRRLDDPYVCQQCDCDPRGSKEEGNCDSYTNPALGLEAGKCSCKTNVEGRRCDHCKPGFWNLHEINPDGCEACSCNQMGTVGNLGCNVNTGECVCKRNVIGRDCNQCAPHYYGLGADEEGCKFCDCDPGGSYSPDCDQVTGQCRCRPHVTGRRCDTPESGHFIPHLDHLTYEAEEAKTVRGSPIMTVRNYDERMFWTGTGFNRMPPDCGIEFDIDNVPTSKLYDVVVRYEPETSGRFNNAQLKIKRPYRIDGYGPCANYSSNNDVRTFSLSSGERSAIIDNVCLEKGVHYQVELDTNQFERPIYNGESPSVLIDSIVLIPKANDIPFLTDSPDNPQRQMYDFEHRCLNQYYRLNMNRGKDIDEYCRKSLQSAGLYTFDGAHPCQCNPTGSISTECETLGGACQCKPYVAPRTCDRCHVGYYGFGPDGCKACDCHRIGSLDNDCDPSTGQCNCRPETYGRQCDECQPGYWNYPNCQRCDCNGLSDMCDSKNGTCIDCRDNTAGPHCEECAEGFYGDPLGRMTGTIVPCRPCPCPGVEEYGMSHAKTCQLDPRTQDVICHCHQGYTGERCDRCDENYFGEPNQPGGQCVSCNCSGNVDISQSGNCNSKTGECLKCLYNTDGPNCEVCKPGFYGNALEHTCVECVCHHLGTDPRSAFCNQTTGQCSCLPNVEGLSCDRCADNHWNLVSQKGCEPCDCDPQGSLSMKCNEIDGQCHCKSTFGGRACDECLPNHYGNPRLQCKLCECNLAGSSSMQCHKVTGDCICIDGISGPKCDRCARGFTGMVPYCEGCGECFESWDNITNILKKETFHLLDKARQIKQTGTTGAYTKEFTQIELNLDEINKILEGQNINKFDLERVQHMIMEAKTNLLSLQDTLNNHEKQLEDTKTNVIDVNFKLDLLANKSAELEAEATALKERTFTLQEANVEGAYNMTKDAQRRSRASKNLVEESSNILTESETKRRNTELLIDQPKGQHNWTFQENILKGIQQEIAEMESGLPNINHLVCDGFSTIDDCDTLCGGAGCGRCGGLSCTKGATTKASTAVELAKKAEQELKDKDRAVKDELRRIKEAREKSDEALEEAKAAFERIMFAKNTSTNTAVEVNDLLDQIQKFLSDDLAQAKDVRKIAEECKQNTISLDEDQIRNLALEINKTIAGLKDIDRILDETRDSLAKAQNLKIKADSAKIKANDILSVAERVKKTLQEAAEAQRKAKLSIDKADQAINTIDQNLQEIDEKAGRAKNDAEEAKMKIGDLNDRLGNLTKKYTSNKFNIENAEKEAYNATAYSNEANKMIDELEQKYQNAAQKLDQKSKVSDDLKKRAKDLKDNASILLNNVSVKLKSIEGKNKSIYGLMIGFTLKLSLSLSLSLSVFEQNSRMISITMTKNWMIFVKRSKS